MNDGGYMISNQHSVTTMGESLPEILNPLDPECEPSSVSPLENHEYTLVCNKYLIEEILVIFRIHEDIFLFIQICLIMISHMSIHQFIIQ
jgi:hypothetical protein